MTLKRVSRVVLKVVIGCNIVSEHSKKMSTKKKAKKKRKPVPVSVLNEIKIGLAMRGYSTMAEKDKMSIREQWLFLERFYHGKGNTHPSQVDLLVKGIGVYADLWDQRTPTVTNKNHQGVGYQLVLKKEAAT